MRPRRLLAARPQPPQPRGAKSIATVPGSNDYTLVALRGEVYAGLLRNVVSGDDAARHLHLHRRTLNRRLKEAGTTFRRVLDQVRFALARELLSSTNMHIAEIAARLGYRVPSAFTRAFRRWSGSSPTAWRLGASSARDTAHLHEVP